MFRRSFILAIVGFIATLVTFTCVMAAPAAHQRFALDVTLQSPQGGLSQVFYDTGKGFNEQESTKLVAQHDSSDRTYRFQLPPGKISALRFNPPRGGGLYHIHAVTLVDPARHAVRQFPLEQFVANNDISGIALTPGDMALTVSPTALDPYIVIFLKSPLVLPRTSRTFVLRGAAASAGGGLAAAGIALLLLRLGFIARAKSILGRIGARFSVPDFLPLDHIAIAFYASIFLFFLIMTACQFHGSSFSIQSVNLDQDVAEQFHPILGQPRGIRVDEWNTHTPALLYQLARPDTLNVNDGVSGPDKSTLITCIPAKHFSNLFHPQFWGFFIFPRDLAFSAYWQMKTLLLLTGLFTLFLMLTRSSKLACFGALWFYFSPYTQWAFSWPDGLPEMIGSFCLATVFACHTLKATSWRAGIVAGLCGAFFALNCILLPYPPFQIPFVWIGVAILAGFFCAHFRTIVPNVARPLLCLTLLLGIVGLVTFAFLHDIKTVYQIAAHTVYPGRRTVPGGLVPAALPQMLSNFMDMAKREGHIPAALGNICEASGYFWLAPITLLLARRRRARPSARIMYMAIWIPLLLIGAWLLCPIPIAVGKIFLLNLVPSPRCLPALGLANIAAVLLFLRFAGPSHKLFAAMTAAISWREARTAAARIMANPRFLLQQSALFLGTLLLALAAFFLTNDIFLHFFTTPTIVAAALFTTLMIGCLINRLPGLLLLLILPPLFYSYAFINPLDRGFPLLDSSQLTALQATHTLKPGKWIVFSESWMPAPSFVAAHGIDVFNYFHYIPDPRAMAEFDPGHKYSNVYNQSGYILTYVNTNPGPATFDSASHGMINWHVSPTDPAFARLGIRYVAFYGKPDAAVVPPDKLRPIADHSFDGFWIYELIQ